ncbi:MAG TPA: hypothetical protein PLU43_05965, partial [Lachnospiraceae bacterium]|nr:hypothetical protein [Lachnospiraceae bacterium]
NTIFKRMSLKERIKRRMLQYPYVSQFLEEEAADGGEEPTGKEAGQTIFLLFSDFGLADEQELGVLLEKACYINENYRVLCEGRIAAVIYTSYEQYVRYRDRKSIDNFEKIETEAFIDLSNVNHFRQFITSGFDARFFNVLSGDDYTVVKSSDNSMKLRAEYEFYKLLPDEMKMWFVMPFDFREKEGLASYTMERYHMTDLAIRYVHGAVSQEEFTDILEKLFCFIRSRKIRQVSNEEYEKAARLLYVDKVDERIAKLKESSRFQTLEALLRSGTIYGGIDGITAKYKELYKKITAGRHFRPVLAIGHGDLCFSNILYNQDASILRLIDPKGAMDEASLYMNPYYDIAKLSHSICGNYDYFNSDLFEITLDEQMRFKLTVDCDNGEYVAAFKEYLEKNELDYKLIRLYEASLFLSMLPLHIDREKKVFAFVLNAVKILEELEEEECIKD